MEPNSSYTKQHLTITQSPLPPQYKCRLLALPPPPPTACRPSPATSTTPRPQGRRPWPEAAGLHPPQLLSTGPPHGSQEKISEVAPSAGAGWTGGKEVWQHPKAKAREDRGDRPPIPSAPPAVRMSRHHPTPKPAQSFDASAPARCVLLPSFRKSRSSTLLKCSHPTIFGFWFKGESFACW